MSTLRLLLLGEPAVEGPSAPVRIPSRKGQALLWFLAAQPGRAFARSYLCALLWERQGESESRHSLSMVLTRLRAVLPLWPLDVDRDAVSWNPNSGAEVDTALFERLEHVEQLEALSQAAQLWRGPFLDGFSLGEGETYDEWLQHARSAWEQRVLEALTRLLGLEAAAGSWPDLLAHARKALAINPLEERFHRWVMLAHHAMGNRAAAVAQYAACEELLRKELGVSPDPATQALRDAIIAGTLPRKPDPGLLPTSLVVPRVIRPSPPSAQQNLRRASGSGDRFASGLPLVGRESEIQRIEQLLGREDAGMTRPSPVRALLLTGEPGVGKSRLVEEVVGRARGSGTGWGTVLVGHAHESSQDLPYAPIVQALTDASTRIDWTRLELPAVCLADLRRLVPDLGSPSSSELLLWRVLDPAQERQRLFEAVARFVTALPRPVLVVLEDIHVADAITLQLLGYLVRHPLAESVAFLMTARDTEIPQETERLLWELEREGRLVWKEVGPLSCADIGCLVTAALGRSEPALAEKLYARTGGNPLFAVEILRNYRQREGSAETLPATVAAAVQARVSRLPQEAQDVLGAVAVFSRPVTLDLLRAATGLSDEGVARAVEALVRAGLLREVEGGATGDAGAMGAAGTTEQAGAARVASAVRFTHEVVREAVLQHYASMHRQVLHRRAFRALTEALAAERPASWLLIEEIVEHAEAGGQWGEALEWSLRGAQATWRVSLPSANARFLQRALDCLSHLPDTPDSRRTAAGVRLKLARTFIYVDPGRIGEWVAQAEEDARAVGDPVLEGRVTLARATLDCLQGRLQKAREVLQRMLPTARAVLCPVEVAGLLTVLGITLAQQGEFEGALAAFGEAAPVQEQAGHLLEAVVIRISEALVLAVRGEFERARAAYQEMARRNRERGDGVPGAYCLAFHAIQAGVRGDWEESHAASEAAILLALGNGYPFQVYLAHLYLGPALLNRGEPERARATLERVIELARDGGTRIWIGHAHAWLAEARLALGQVEAAEEAARAGLAIAEEQGARYDRALCTKVLGKAALARGAVAEAQARFSEAMAEFAAMGARPEEARCRALLGQRRQAEAMFRSMRMVWDLEQLDVTPVDAGSPITRHIGA